MLNSLLNQVLPLFFLIFVSILFLYVLHKFIKPENVSKILKDNFKDVVIFCNRNNSYDIFNLSTHTFIKKNINLKELSKILKDLESYDSCEISKIYYNFK